MGSKALEAYRGRRVLITGHTGFKGAWLTLWLTKLGAEVLGYALAPERPDDLFNQLSLTDQIRHVIGDVRDLKTFSAVTAEFQPQLVFHLAAQSLVRRSYEEPQRTFDTNVIGSVNVLEAVRKAPSIQALIYVTSDKCYRNKEWIWGYRENDELGGHDPYSSSKAAAELAFSAYQESFFNMREGFGSATVRAGNVVGGGDWAVDRIVPDSIKMLASSQPIRLRNPEAIRPWQHVLEPLSGYLTLALRLIQAPQTFRGAWNFGPGPSSVRTVREVAESMVRGWGNGTIETAGSQEVSVHEARLLALNCEKAHQQLGWKTQWDFDRTMSETVSWYKHVSEGRLAQDVSLQQISSYEEGLQ